MDIHAIKINYYRSYFYLSRAIGCLVSPLVILSKMLVPLLLLMSVFMVVEIESFNRIFDVLTLVYTVGVIAILYLYRKKSSSIQDTSEDRTYSYKKKSKVQTWQQKMSGTWKKVERTGFYEVSASIIKCKNHLSFYNP
jgi:hypothetical protein